MPPLSYTDNIAVYADMALAIGANDGPWDLQAGGGAAPLDATGGPQAAAVSSITGAYPSGNYAVSWDGPADALTFEGQTLGSVTSSTTGGVTHNTATLAFTQKLSSPEGSVYFQIKTSSAISNLHIQAPDSLVASGHIFLNDYLRLMQPYSSIRVMQLLNMDSPSYTAKIRNWGDRTWPTSGSRVNRPGGIAYEDIVALANETGKDVWINVPVAATDEFVCRLARLFRYGEQGTPADTTTCVPGAAAGTADITPINSKSKIYVEYSNEVWNNAFQQWVDIYCMANAGLNVLHTDGTVARACDSDLATPPSAFAAAALANPAFQQYWAPAAAGTSPNGGFTREDQLAGVLTKRQSDIFRSVFGCTNGDGCQAQIVYNVQAANPDEADDMLAFQTKAYGNANAIDALAIAPYFYTLSASDNDSVDDIFSALDQELAPGGKMQDWLTKAVTLANKYNLKVVAYEGGNGITENAAQDAGADAMASNSANAILAQSDPRMYGEVQKYLALWGSVVGKDALFTYFDWVSSEYAPRGYAWGLLINQDDPGSQKYDGVMSQILLAGDANLDGVVNSADCAILNANFGASNRWWMQGDFNHDGLVNAADLTMMNANITGVACAH
jgi:hypothetical protein